MYLTGKDIKELKQQVPVSEYQQNESYYRGYNTEILNKAQSREPDNRVPVAFANRLIKNLTGYAGRTGDIKTVWKQMVQSSDDSFVRAYNHIEEDSMLSLLNSRLYKTVLKQGAAYDLVWTETDINGNLMIKCADIPIQQSLPVWDDELSVVKKLNSFIRYYDVPRDMVEKWQGKDLQFPAGHYAQVFTADGYQIWFLDPMKPHGNGSADKSKLIVEQAQPFGEVQVSTYFGNDEKMAYWRPVKNLIDQFDKIMSGSMNEADRFNDTWLMFMQKVSPEAKKAIDEMGIIDNLQNALNETVSDVWPRFLERNIPVAHTQLMLNTLENLIYTIIGVPSFLDETFGSASGVSLLFRLIGLEYAAVETDTYFDIGLQHRNDLIKTAMGTITTYKGVPYTEESRLNHESVIEHKRNIPLDKTTIINDALQLRGVGVSMETVLKYLPREVVPDIQAELDLIGDEMATRIPPMDLDSDAV